MRIGKKIKQLRKKYKLSMTELSRKSGVQLATLSRIENRKMTGTVESHLQIAKAFGIDIIELYGDENPQYRCIEAKGQKSDPELIDYNQRSSYEILTTKILSKKMMPLLIKIEPGGKTGIEESPEGSEKFIWILKGHVTAYIAQKAYALEESNTLYFSASAPHYFANTSEEEARILCIATPVSI